MIEEKVGQPTFFMPIGKAMNRMEQVRQIAEPTVKALGYEWVGCELQSSRPPVLRIYVDRENGVTLDDCAVISRQLSALFDVEQVMADAYQLEISSPGLDRPLFTMEDYKKFIGRAANIQLSIPLEGRRNFKGVIVDVSSADVLMCVENENFKVRNLRCLQRRQGRWGVQRGAMQCSPMVAVRAGFPRRRNQLRKQSRPLAAELLKLPLAQIAKGKLVIEDKS